MVCIIYEILKSSYHLLKIPGQYLISCQFTAASVWIFLGMSGMSQRLKVTVLVEAIICICDKSDLLRGGSLLFVTCLTLWTYDEIDRFNLYKKPIAGWKCVFVRTESVYEEGYGMHRHIGGVPVKLYPCHFVPCQLVPKYFTSILPVWVSQGSGSVRGVMQTALLSLVNDPSVCILCRHLLKLLTVFAETVSSSILTENGHLACLSPLGA